MAKIQPSQCRVPGLNPWSENWIPTCHMPQLRVHTPQLGKTKILVELQQALAPLNLSCHHLRPGSDDRRWLPGSWREGRAGQCGPTCPGTLEPGVHPAQRCQPSFLAELLLTLLNLN